MSRRVPRRIAGVLSGAVAFGVLVAAIKGQDTGVRDALGNTSAPWVVVPFLAGARCPSLRSAALVGLAATLAAFFGFYLAEAAILDLGPHPWYVDIRLTLGSGRVYEYWGLVSGSLYGALGWAWASRRLVAGPIAVGLAFAAEPLIVLFLQRAGVWGGGELMSYPAVWIGEVAIGVACMVLAISRARRGAAADLDPIT